MENGKINRIYEKRISKKKIEPRFLLIAKNFRRPIFQRTWEINLCNLDVSSYIVVLDATCTPRRQFFWRTLSFGVRLRAARGETEDIESSGRFTARSFDRNPAKGGENLAQVIVPTDLLHDDEKNRQTFI